MHMMKYKNEKAGNIFFIPLFLENNMKENTKNYSKYNFYENSRYAFGRLIEKNDSNGNLVEIFNYIGNIPDNIDVILNSGLLLQPFHVGMAFSKKRWRFIAETENYDKIQDSNYNNISFKLGDEDAPILWKGGNKSQISPQDANNYMKWIIHHPTRVEEAIRSNNLEPLKI